MLPSRLKTRPNGLLKLSAMSLVVATLSGCGEDAKDCGGFWDKTFGREECAVALPVAAIVPQLPLGANVVQNTFQVSAEAQQVLAGQSLAVSSLIDSSTALNGQIKTDAQADIISVMRGEEILLMQPVLDGKPQTTEVSFESTALQIVLMDVKFGGSDVATRKRVIDKIRQHAKFPTLVAQVKLAVTSGISNPLDAVNSPSIYTTADEISSDVGIGEPVTAQPLASSLLRGAYGAAAIASEAAISPAHADSTVFQGREHMSAAIAEKDQKKQITFTNKSMVAYAVYDANSDSSNFRVLDPAKGKLQGALSQCFVKLLRKIDGVEEKAPKVPITDKCLDLGQKNTDVILDEVLSTQNRTKSYQQLALVGGSALWRDYSSNNIADILGEAINPLQPRGMANWYNALTLVDFGSGLVALSSTAKGKEGDIKSVGGKLAKRLELSKAALENLSFFFDIANAGCDSIVKTVTSDVNFKSSEQSIARMQSTCEYLRVGKELSDKVVSVYKYTIPEPAEKNKKKLVLGKVLVKAFGITDLAETATYEEMYKAVAVQIVKLSNEEGWAKIQKNFADGIAGSANTLYGSSKKDLDLYMAMAAYLFNGNDTAGEVFTKLQTVATIILSDPDVQAKIAGWAGDGLKNTLFKGYQELRSSSWRRLVIAGAKQVGKGVEIGVVLGNQLLPFVWDMSVTPSHMSVTLVNGKISNVPAHQPNMTIKVNDVLKYDYRQRQDMATLNEPLDVQVGDVVDIEYSAVQPSVYSNDGTPDLAHDADGAVLVDKYKYPTKLHSFKAILNDTEGGSEVLVSGLFCVRNPLLETTQFAFSSDPNEYGCVKGDDKGNYFFGKYGTNEEWLPNEYPKIDVQKHTVSDIGVRNHTVRYSIQRTITDKDSRLAILFDSYGGNTSDYIQVGFKQHRKATATLEAVDDLGDVVDYFVYVGKQIQIKLTSISTAIADVAWRLFDDFNNEIPLVDDNYQDFTKDDIWAGSGKYTIRAEMTDEFGYVIGSAEKTLEGIALGFADATVSPTTMPINQPVTVRITGRGFPLTTVFTLENATCNSPLRDTDAESGITTLSAICTPTTLGDLRLTLYRKLGVNAGSKEFIVEVVDANVVAGEFVVPAIALNGVSFTPPVDNPFIADEQKPHYGASRKKFQCNFTSTGKVKTYFSYPETDANGYSTSLNGFPSMALLATRQQLGENKETSLIGTSKKMVVAAGDFLKFYANDDSYADNIGQFTVAYTCKEPKAAIQPSTTTPVAGTSTTFSLIDTLLEDVSAVIWRIGDTIVEAYNNIISVFSYIFDKAGDYFVSATVTSSDQTLLTTSTQVTVTAAPPVASLVGSAITGEAGQPVTFVLSNSVAKEGKLCSYFFNNGEGVDSRNSGCGNDGLPVVFLPITMTYTKAGTFTPTLTVTDSQGKSATVTWLVNVSEAVKTARGGLLTATGINTCGNNIKNGLLCTPEALGDLYGSGQDGELRAGLKMSYTTLSQGNEECLKDNATGLIWEQKTDDGGLRDKDWNYTWYASGNSTHGTLGSDTCGGVLNGQCNTQAYLAALNAKSYCGYNDWRIPTRMELLSITDRNRTTAINPAFVNTQPSYYWTTSLVAAQGDSAWYVEFLGGRAADQYMSNGYSVRVVRGDWSSATAANVRYELINNGREVLDNQTKLIWSRCSLGQTWDGSACTGSAIETSWSDALLRARSLGSGYRLPNIKELESLVDETSQPAINSLFVASPYDYRGYDGYYWSSSLVHGDDNYAWIVVFFNGETTGGTAAKLARIRSRPVRSQSPELLSTKDQSTTIGAVQYTKTKTGSTLVVDVKDSGIEDGDGVANVVYKMFGSPKPCSFRTFYTQKEYVAQNGHFEIEIPQDSCGYSYYLYSEADVLNVCTRTSSGADGKPITTTSRTAVGKRSKVIELKDSQDKILTSDPFGATINVPNTCN